MFTILFIFFIFILLKIIDLFLKYGLKKDNELIRWYYLHAIMNFVICLSCINDIKLFLTDPIDNLLNPINTQIPSIVATLLHIYHMIFFNCNSDDYFHHLTFVFISAFLSIFINFGRVVSLFNFFICGLPGGIDYLLLGLYKDNKIEKELRIKVAVELNMWLRSPGIVITSAYIYIWYIYSDRSYFKTFAFITMVLLSIGNAQYYARMVTLYAGKNLNDK